MLLKSNCVWLLLLICCLPFGRVNAEGFVVIKGKTEAKKELAEMQLMTVKNGVPVRYAGTTIASAGGFAFMFEPEKTDFYYLYDGQDYFRLYVSAGEQINVMLKDGSCQFTGICSEENQLLQQWRNREQYLRTYKRNSPYSGFFPLFDSVRLETNSWLDKVNIENKDFLEQLKAVVQLDLLNDFVMYVAKNQRSYVSEEQQSAYYQGIIGRFPAEDASLLMQPYGMELLRSYFDYKRNYVFRSKDYTLEQRLAEIISPALKAEFVLMQVDISSFAVFCEYERKYFPLLQNDEQRFRLSHTPGRPQSSLKVGEQASNFIYPDASGRFWSMADFRGKYKYIDIWATWCAPCKAEIPYLQELESEFAGENIEFISISIDKNRKKWMEYIHAQKLGGIQLWASDWTNLPKELHIGSIPRFMLIDPDGNWVNTNGARPSDPALKELLKNLLKK